MQRRAVRPNRISHQRDVEDSYYGHIHISENAHGQKTNRRRNPRLMRQLLLDLAAMLVLHFLLKSLQSYYTTLNNYDSIQEQNNKQPNDGYKFTGAAKNEQALQNRILVHAMYLTQTCLEPLMQSNIPAIRQDYQQVFVALFVNPTRVLPFVNAFIISHLWNIEKDPYSWNNASVHTLMEQDILQIHLFDTRFNNGNSSFYSSVDPYRLTVLQLSFLQYYSPSDSTSTSFFTPTYHHHPRCHTMDYYIRASQACLDSSLSYCLFLQESTLLPTYFTSTLKEWILQEATHNVSSVWNHEIISFFSMIQTSVSRNNEDSGDSSRSGIRVLDVGQEIYSSSFYKYDQSLLNSQRKQLKLPPYQPQFSIYSSSIMEEDPSPDRARNVALWIPRKKIEENVLPFLISQMTLCSSDDNLQTFDLEYELAMHTQKTLRYHIEPSLINHMGGLYDTIHEDEDDASFLEWITDPRFMLDPGLYQQGLDFYCKDETDGSWYKYDEPVDCTTL